MELISEMEKSMTVNISHHCDDPNRRSSESHQARLDGRVASEEDEVNVGMSAFEDLGNKLFYHTWPTESGKHNYEIDFLLSRGTKIVPVEVKSSTYKTHVSMDEFCKKFSSRIANDRYLVYTKDYFKDGSMKYIPAYLAYFL